jgi:hypothetical protein
MTTITWTIDSMSTSTQVIDGYSEVVLNAQWRCTGDDGVYFSDVYGTCSFPIPASGGSFTPYADLTQEQVLNWCWANGVDKDSSEISVTASVALKANPPTAQLNLPWVQTQMGA